MERKLTKVVDGTEITVSGKMCSCGTDVANHLCSWECPDTCGISCFIDSSGGVTIEMISANCFMSSYTYYQRTMHGGYNYVD